MGAKHGLCTCYSKILGTLYHLPRMIPVLTIHHTCIQGKSYVRRDFDNAQVGTPHSSPGGPGDQQARKL